ncbi:MAG: RusA family crossover junction endodeoxyribonuclease [Euryarchaeota archaeon]|nr:RusA family crossover junction endodeoxyribonuclease [Euryarchaeota archaeon]
MPEGSTRAFYIPKAKKTVTTHQNKKSLEAWRNRVATEAQRALEGREWVSDRSSAYALEVEFVLSRPPSVPPHRRIHPTVRPDIDKLVRAVNDALTGILFPDDSQVFSIKMVKSYGGERRTGAYVCVSRYVNVTKKVRKARKKQITPAEEDENPFDPRGE